MIIVIDNYDSFTYNLVQYLEELGGRTMVFRNDKVGITKLKSLRPERIVISPGPGNPDDSGISMDVLREFYDKIPILGVCLGHQCLGYFFGAKIIRAGEIMHGKTSDIYHDGRFVFKGIKSPFKATRYHSLIIDKKTLAKNLVITAQTKDGTIMGVRDKRYPLFGVQFHPESILTHEGKKLLDNFLKI